MEESALVLLQADVCAYTSVRHLEALNTMLDKGGQITDAVEYFMNTGFSSLTQLLDWVKKGVFPTDGLLFSSRLKKAFDALQRHVRTFCARVACESKNMFSRIGDVISCLLIPRDIRIKHLPTNAKLPVLEADPAFRAAIVDRLVLAVRQMFAWLCDITRKYDKQTKCAYKGVVSLGANAAKFIELADTAKGTLVMRLPDGRYELFNLTEAEWTTVMPLLCTSDPLGHVQLEKRPHSALTRHDANGDEITTSDAYRLRQYIHSVGRGRGGQKMYFLAPYPRQVNVVDG